MIVTPIMAFIAKRYTVTNSKTEFKMVREGLDVMRSQVATASVTAMLAGKLVTKKHIKSPTLISHRKAFTTSLCQFPILIGMAGIASQSPFAYALANQRTCFKGVLLTNPIARTLFSRIAHFKTGFITHSLAFHWRHERKATSLPRLANLCFCFF